MTKDSHTCMYTCSTLNQIEEYAPQFTCKASRIIAEFSHDEILRMFYHTTVTKVNKCCNLSFQNTILTN